MVDQGWAEIYPSHVAKFGQGRLGRSRAVLGQIYLDVKRRWVGLEPMRAMSAQIYYWGGRSWAGFGQIWPMLGPVGRHVGGCRVGSRKFTQPAFVNILKTSCIQPEDNFYSKSPNPNPESHWPMLVTRLGSRNLRRRAPPQGQRARPEGCLSTGSAPSHPRPLHRSGASRNRAKPDARACGPNVLILALCSAATALDDKSAAGCHHLVLVARDADCMICKHGEQRPFLRRGVGDDTARVAETIEISGAGPGVVWCVLQHTAVPDHPFWPQLETTGESLPNPRPDAHYITLRGIFKAR